jgi:carbonic anhydrase/acetyltransferase-like protein (isoleucine patch superfamily)
MSVHSLDGRAPVLAADAWIAGSASVIGNVSLGAGVSVWFGAVVRGDGEDITIGDLTNIQDLSVLHTDTGFPLTIGPGCTIGHRAILHGCTIGENSLIGMGAILLNGARIGRDCLIGAGALVTEGKVIPDGSLVLGAPGRVVRSLTPDEIAANRRSAGHYAANAARFRAGLAGS